MASWWKAHSKCLNSGKFSIHLPQYHWYYPSASARDILDGPSRLVSQTCCYVHPIRSHCQSPWKGALCPCNDVEIIMMWPLLTSRGTHGWCQVTVTASWEDDPWESLSAQVSGALGEAMNRICDDVCGKRCAMRFICRRVSQECVQEYVFSALCPGVHVACI